MGCAQCSVLCEQVDEHRLLEERHLVTEVITASRPTSSLSLYLISLFITRTYIETINLRSALHICIELPEKQLKI